MRKRQATKAARSEVLCYLAAFAALQLGLAVAVENWRVGLRDPEYGVKRDLLKRKLRASPGRPLALVLGSSRVLDGLRPELLPEYHTPQGTPVVFNFGLTGHGPLHQLLVMKRLLKAGIRPRWVFIEVVPSLLALPWPLEAQVKPERLGWADLAVLRRYTRSPARLYLKWLQARADAWFTYRFRVLHGLRKDWLPNEARTVEFWNDLSACGWLPLRTVRPDPREYARRVELERPGHAPQLQAFRLMPVMDRALRELLDLCRRERIATALLLTPESYTFRSWYAPQTTWQVHAYLAALWNEFRVPAFDARCWVYDGGFNDAHHLLPEGAALFTQRFGWEVLGPFLGAAPGFH